MVLITVPRTDDQTSHPEQTQPRPDASSEGRVVVVDVFGQIRHLLRSRSTERHLLPPFPGTDGSDAFQGPTPVSVWYHTHSDQNRFIDCPVRFQANRLKNVFPSEWHREHQVVYVRTDLLNVAGRVPGGVAICGRADRTILRRKLFAAPLTHVQKSQSRILYICANQIRDDFSRWRDADDPP
jgi:hypothetical protein